MTYGAMVMIDIDGSCSCPYHGMQPGAEYEPMNPAPCGCVWRSDSHGVLRSHRAEVVDMQQELSESSVTRHKGQTT